MMISQSLVGKLPQRRNSVYAWSCQQFGRGLFCWKQSALNDSPRRGMTKRGGLRSVKMCQGSFRFIFYQSHGQLPQIQNLSQFICGLFFPCSVGFIQLQVMFFWLVNCGFILKICLSLFLRDKTWSISGLHGCNLKRCPEKLKEHHLKMFLEKKR